MLRYYRVFNAAQAGHLPERFYPAPGQETEIAEPQAVLDRYLADGPELRHVPGDRAAYNPATDTIQLPLRTQFRAPEHYYATAFHEAGHSTGHPQRLNRPGIADFDHFGSGQYAKEELIAQMTSSMLCAQTSIDTPEVFDESASYIAGWLHALNDDKRLVITAAAHAQRASDLIAQPEHQVAPDNEHSGNSPATSQPTRDFERDAPVPASGHARASSEPHARPGTSDAAKRPGDWQAEAG